MISYQISLKSPESHLYQVSLTVPDPDLAGQRFYLPAWIRGSYMIRDFARHVVTLQASCQDRQLGVNKLDKQTWQVEPCHGELNLTYTIYAWDLSVRASHLDITHGYFNGTSVFLGVEGRQHDPCQVTIVAPEGKSYSTWRVATAMPVQQIDARGFGLYHLPDYEALIDHPVEIGDFTVLSFDLAQAEHRLVISGRQQADSQRLLADLRKVCAKHVELFGELPIDDYLFLLWVVGEGYGGLEHCNSTSLLCSRDDLPTTDMTEMGKGYRRLLGLCSHEYFHLWNVKRMMPAVFQQHGMQEEVYTRQLWVFEGITSYYDELALVRSGVIDRKNYFELLAETITRVMRGSGRHKQTLEEASFDAWTKFYKQDENAPNAIVSYYTKGGLFALCLDLHIRLKSQGESSLDNVMRQFWQQYGKTGIGVAEGDFEQLAADVTGLDLQPLFDLGLRSTQALPIKELLAQFAVEMQLVPAQSSEDKGRVLEQSPADDAAKPVLGARWVAQGAELQLLQVFDDGAAQAAGLSAGDVIIAVDGLRLNAKQLEQRIARCTADQQIRLHFFRRDQLMEVDIQPRPAPADTCVFYLPDTADQQQIERRIDWLHEIRQ